ncbi:MAG: diheme cytochrome c [Nitrospirae bacterium]|nr:diheme cytochrome c [Nitrospirota bacterium]
MKKIIISIAAGCFFLSGMITVSKVYAADERGERHERGERYEREGAYNVPGSPLYKQECSSCHFLYLPGLLPSRSWQEIIKNNDKHFGENLSLEDKDREEILSYLTKYSAENVNTEWSKRILKSIGSGTPARITEIPYITLRHRNIRTELFKRPSVGSFSNCGACHPGGANGDFEEDRVRIPK